MRFPADRPEGNNEIHKNSVFCTFPGTKTHCVSDGLNCNTETIRFGNNFTSSLFCCKKNDRISISFRFSAETVPERGIEDPAGAILTDSPHRFFIARDRIFAVNLPNNSTDGGKRFEPCNNSFAHYTCHPGGYSDRPLLYRKTSSGEAG